jgi:hypothetical protein
MSESLQDAAIAALSISRNICRQVGARHAMEASAESFLGIMRSAIP